VRFESCHVPDLGNLELHDRKLHGLSCQSSRLSFAVCFDERTAAAHFWWAPPHHKQPAFSVSCCKAMQGSMYYHYFDYSISCYGGCRSLSSPMYSNRSSSLCCLG
jgi:hypothetical protein